MAHFELFQRPALVCAQLLERGVVAAGHFCPLCLLCVCESMQLIVMIAAQQLVLLIAARLGVGLRLGFLGLDGAHKVVAALALLLLGLFLVLRLLQLLALAVVEFVEFALLCLTQLLCEVADFDLLAALVLLELERDTALELLALQGM